MKSMRLHPSAVLPAACILWLWTAAVLSVSAGQDPFARFMTLKWPSDFQRTDEVRAGETVFLSGEIEPGLDWNELIVSWNALTPPGAFLKIEARGIYPGHATKFYTLAVWSQDGAGDTRRTVKGQKDADGTVDTETLMLNRHGGKAQLRLTLAGAAAPKIKFIGASFCNTKAGLSASAPEPRALGVRLPVPELSQTAYHGGTNWCSAVSVVMTMNYWADKKQRRDWECRVPEAAAAIYDSVWRGTGNWTFNTAYAGTFPGIRAYVARLGGVEEVEQWIAAGIPVVVSVDSPKLIGKMDRPPNGHLIVVTGFEKNGDVRINNPWGPPLGPSVARTCKREHFLSAWNYSKRTAYLIYPESVKPPRDLMQHWD